MNETEQKQLETENAALRALLAQHTCVYGYRSDAGVCALGYPGCACADDLVVWDAERSQTLGAEMEALRARIKELEAQKG